MHPLSVPSVAARDVGSDARILDVREQDEWDAGHIDGALHVPLADVPAHLAELAEQEGDDPLVVVCRAGGRSARAVAWLTQNGVDAVNLDGGMGAWADAGQPMVSELGSDPFVR